MPPAQTHDILPLWELFRNRMLTPYLVTSTEGGVGGKEKSKIWELKAFWCQDLPSDQVNGPRNLISLFLPSPVPRMPASCQLRHSLLCLRSQPVVKSQAQELNYLSFNSLIFQSLYSVGLGIKHRILIPSQ